MGAGGVAGHAEAVGVGDRVLLITIEHVGSAEGGSADADGRDPLDLLGDQVCGGEVVGDGHRSVVGQQARTRAGLALQGGDGRFGQLDRPGRCVWVGHEDALAARPDVLVADPLEIHTRHRMGGGMPRVRVHHCADVGSSAHQRNVHVELAGGGSWTDPRAVGQVDDRMVAGDELVVGHATGRHHDAVVVETDAHVARRADHETVGDHAHAGVVHRPLCITLDHGGSPIDRTVLFDPMRTIDWHHDHVVAIDQTLLPHELRTVQLRSVDELVAAIQRLAIRGAPALGIAGAFGVALAALDADRRGLGRDHIEAEAARVAAARPTAVNLAWGVGRCMSALDGGASATVALAVAMADDDVATNRRLARRGADLVASLVRGPVAVHTHCNAGGLACVEWGTALGVVRALHDDGLIREVFADETRPLLQGARLTAFELEALGVPHRVVVDGAGPSVIASGMVDVVIVGADRIAANGDVVNKIGTYPLALAADRAGVPFLVVAPESTVDLLTACGADVPIELRSSDEVVTLHGTSIAPPGTLAWNPAFDVTPFDLVTALVTEQRVVRLARGELLTGTPEG